MVDVPEQFNMQPNPLLQYTRQPSIYIKLPSNGNFWAFGMLDTPINGEHPVLPMSTRDEIALNTPDALMNGQAVVDMIQSCMPSIKNAWAVPATDLDAILIAIRIATYGETMEYTSTCPSCENTDTYEIDLRQFLDMPIDIEGYNTPFEYKGMQIYLQPVDYQTLNLQNLETFEQQRLVVMIDDSNLDPEQKQERFYEIFRKMTQYTVANTAGAIAKIVTPDGNTVSDRRHIDEFVQQAEAQLFKSLRDHVALVNKGIPEKKVNTQCPECSNQYETPFTFDQANFFVFAS